MAPHLVAAQALGSKDSPVHLAPVQLKLESVSAETEPKPDFINVAGLTKYGLGVGVAAAFHTAANFNKKKADQRSTAVSAMPYIVLLPRYWFMRGSLTREYCARRSLSLSRSAALKETNFYARKEGREGYLRDLYENRNLPQDRPGADRTPILESSCPSQTACDAVRGALEDDVRGAQGAARDEALAASAAASKKYLKANPIPAGAPPAVVAMSNALAKFQGDAAYVATYPTALASATTDAKHYKRVVDEAAQTYSGWNTEDHGRCGRLSFVGAYLGIPVGYSANARETSEQGPTRKLDVKPKASFGLAIAPSPYLNLLVGATPVGIVFPVGEDETTMRKAWQLTVALGGTVDIIGALISKM